MPEMSQPRDLFLAELQDVYYVEQTLVKTLPKLAKEATDDDLTKAFDGHLAETKGHVDNLQAVFKSIGETARAKQCPGIDGIKAEHDEFMKEEDPTPEICDLFLTGAAARTESYEIAAYTGLVTMAKALGEKEAAGLLEQNLSQEKEAQKKVDTIARRLSKASTQEVARV